MIEKQKVCAASEAGDPFKVYSDEIFYRVSELNKVIKRCTDLGIEVSVKNKNKQLIAKTIKPCV